MDDRISELEAVIQAVSDSLMTEAVELSADLSHLAIDDLFVTASPVRTRVQDRTLGDEIELARAEKRHRRGDHVTYLEYFAGPDEFCCPEDGLRRHQIAGAPLISGPPFRRAAGGFRRRLPGLREDAERSAEHEWDQE